MKNVIKKTKKVRPTSEEIYLKTLGKKISGLITEKGYPSEYDFWVNALGEGISRATLNNVLNGKFDVRLLVLKKIARGLKVDIKTLLDF